MSKELIQLHNSLTTSDLLPPELPVLPQDLPYLGPMVLTLCDEEPLLLPDPLQLVLLVPVVLQTPCSSSIPTLERLASRLTPTSSSSSPSLSSPPSSSSTLSPRSSDHSLVKSGRRGECLRDRVGLLSL
ncbi:hypothetical protein L202_07568 [Cryptococcus amylolentus CBS 6039]|uniref:Uncharacterized protein n=1 Tax=Cryptococcus amylolentus CBS 6039 TaxID=1295533 RepID=A0A1E3HCP4_9TREE|nr:hypothetical protein L202_07568 [Cryptococcus amylolentus CBS 6039]ODN74110.1 hypothetical protein L202_07568 [Cryptococcus amylolentus CBS 6039]